MTKDQIKNKVLSYKDWEWWAERPYGAFVMSLFTDGQNREYMKKAGVNVQWPATFWQKGAFYKSEKVWNDFAKQLEKYLAAGGSVAKVVKACEQYGKSGKRQILKINKAKEPPIIKFNQLYKILTLDISFVWLTHGLEHVYKKKLYKEVPKYIPSEQVDKFIGDISFPVKKNAHYYLEQALRGDLPLDVIQKRFGWIKARDGFSDGFTIKELSGDREQLKKSVIKKYKYPKIPKQLQALAKIAQELVYLRTLRTDILYELMSLAKPILKEVGNFYKIPYKELIDYAAQDLLAGKPKKYPRNISWISYGKEWAIFNQPILNENYGKQTEIKGMIANHGLATGRAKIVKTAYEIEKVKAGDILFAPTTAPSYIIGMKKAAAFVTDEGGITSHAAIVSREMGKPCIIGTKIATKIFKDGDLVEVDADKGIVRKIK